MAKVSVRVWPTLTALFGAETIRSRALEVEVADGAPTEQVSVVVNDRLPELLDGLATRLRDGDRVMLVQAYAGG